MQSFDINNLKKNAHIHFIGIGGISMSGLAHIAVSDGYKVTGSDRTKTNITDKLENEGAVVYEGHDAKNIIGADLVVHTAAVKMDNPEMAAAVENNIKLIDRAEFLGALMKNYKNAVGVAGTHGKTTTTSMLAHALIYADTDPTISVGGELDLIGGNIRCGKSDMFVTEACEYTNSFLKFYPTIALITNIEEDHLDFFTGIEMIRDSFRSFAELTNGLGAGAKPEVGRQAAEETKDEIKNIVKDADMVFVTAGMGGGTGTGAAPIIAEAAKSAGILTVAVVTKPFAFEGPQRMRNAEEGIKNLAERVDSIVTIPNDLLLKIADKKVTINDSFKLADDILRQGVQGIIEIITQKGIVNCDFADVRTIMKDSGVAHMGIGVGKGENAAQDAVRAAIESPLLETSIAGAENVLLNITGGTEFSLVDMGEVSGLVREMVSEEANIIVGTAMDEELKDEIKVTLIATGLNGEQRRAPQTKAAPRISTASSAWLFAQVNEISFVPSRPTDCKITSMLMPFCASLENILKALPVLDHHVQNRRVQKGCNNMFSANP